MSIRQRLMNLRAYADWAHMKAVVGLLSDDARQRWCRFLVPVALDRAEPYEILPWIVFGATDELQRRVRPAWRVLEFGSGFSTLWWLGRVASVTSIERCRSWSDQVEARAGQLGLGGKLTLKRMPELDADVKVGWLDRYSATDVAALQARYLGLAGKGASRFEVVVVDDVWREEAVRAATEWLVPGGILVLDNSRGYEAVAEALHELGYSSHVYSGAVPYTFVESQTTLFFKPAAAV